MRKKHLTEEEKVAQKLATVVSDLRLDIELIGQYLAEISPYVSYNRLQVIAESAKHHKEEKYVRDNQYTLF
jgi:hypothetical protein